MTPDRRRHRLSLAAESGVGSPVTRSGSPASTVSARRPWGSAVGVSDITTHRTVSLPAGDGDPDPREASLAFIGTATVLIRCGGFTFLTDPNFLHQGEHAKLGYGLRSRRLTQPALRIEELPQLDFIVLSHHHGDHFDDVAAAQLD